MKRILGLSLVLACGSTPLSTPAGSTNGPVAPLNGAGAAPGAVAPAPGAATSPLGPPGNLPALTILTPSEVQSPPSIPSSCPAAGPKAVVHHPGPCTLLRRDGAGSAPLSTQRTRRAYDAHALISETTEDWYGTDFERNSTAWSLARDGRPLRSVWLSQYVDRNDPAGGSSASVGFTDFFYDEEELLTSSTTTLASQGSGQQPTPLHVAQQDSYFVDALGRQFLVKAFVPHRGEILSSELTLFPSGAVESETTTQPTLGGPLTERHFYDLHGALLLHDTSSTGRGQLPVLYYASEQYHYDNGLLTSVDSDMFTPNGPPAGHTTWRYDESRDNVERTTTDRAGRVVARWIGVYDSAHNLVCEQQTADASDLFHNFVVHYDYSCF